MSTALAEACIIACLSWVVVVASTNITYTPDWASLDTRPLPSWYDEGKIGIFVHWGVFSVPSYVSEWFWWYWQGKPPNPQVWVYMQTYYGADFSYPDFAQNFHAEFFNPQQWAEIFNASGAQYVVLTAKHHEGYCNWPSPVSWNWNSMDAGPQRDLVDDLAKAIRSTTKLRFGVYHSMFEWFNPLYLADKASGYKEQTFVDRKTMPELMDLVNRYQPSVVWSDGAPATSDYWKAKEFLAWLYNDSPVKNEVVVNDRWGSDANCQHGDFFNCEDRYHPDKLLSHKWESCITLDRYSWGYRRESRLADYLSPQELIEFLISVVAYGGNLLVNVGPTSWGTIPPIYEERLLTMGQWLKMNGEAIYRTTPWKYQIDSKRMKLWYLQKSATKGDPVVYALFSDWPSINSNPTLSLAQVKAAKDVSKFTLLDGNGGATLSYAIDDVNGSVIIHLPPAQPTGSFVAWAIRMENVQPV
ncbi:fucosidase alpha L 1 tissue [Echinococcus multilocularis]|uniref:alpha-L-fucosidase n=1 Tax=Echinococcus multilocularis TaxID=6211 RepID=A0A068Y6A2_ECHMU|nr:fucosidase alpha L 1 tissue [Echinococcus multilocularis]